MRDFAQVSVEFTFDKDYVDEKDIANNSLLDHQVPHLQCLLKRKHVAKIGLFLGLWRQ